MQQKRVPFGKYLLEQAKASILVHKSPEDQILRQIMELIEGIGQIEMSLGVQQCKIHGLSTENTKQSCANFAEIALLIEKRKQKQRECDELQRQIDHLRNQLPIWEIMADGNVQQQYEQALKTQQILRVQKTALEKKLQQENMQYKLIQQIQAARKELKELHKKANQQQTLKKQALQIPIESRKVDFQSLQRRISLQRLICSQAQEKAELFSRIQQINKQFSEAQRTNSELHQRVYGDKENT